ncbi:MAG: ABC transporter substrate-binding protein [Actinomycetota bacterium]|jgi:spermidine/putrescine transport system substrate-binding protein|nr:MAG: ABC transporter substrate-binding protein [Actinomycetota bacterium]
MIRPFDRWGLVRIAAALAALLLVAVSCGGGPQDGGGATSPGAGGTTGRCGDPERLGDTLNFYNWADYIDEAILESFEQECGVRVRMDTYTSNEEAIAKIRAGNSGYSLVIPTDYAVQIMIDEGLLRPLDMANIPNVANIDPKQMGQYYDPDNTYSIPYQYSTTGLAYNVTAFDTPPDSWGVLFDQNRHCGQSSLLEDQREVIGAALVYLGYDWNETDPEAHEKALDLLLDARECVSGFDSANYIGNLASGEVVVAQSWGFAAGIARAENPDVAYTIPKEGGTIWQDNFVIPADAPDPYTAEVFINYMLEPDIGALLTEFTLGFTPNLKVEPLLSDDYHQIIDEGGIAITDEVRERLVWQVRGPEHDIFAKTWEQVVAAG